MKTFRDNASRTWNLALNVYAVKKVRDLMGVDLLDLDSGDKPEDKLLSRLIADPILLVDLLYVVCKGEADQKGVTDEQFGQAMAGDVIDTATKAFLEELADFTPSPRDRARARKVIQATWTVIDRAQDLMDAKVEKELPAAVEKFLAEMAEMTEMSAPGSSSTNSPDSSEPTPDP